MDGIEEVKRCLDARDLGIMETRVLKVFTNEDIAKIADTVKSWKTGERYEDVGEFCDQYLW